LIFKKVCKLGKWVKIILVIYSNLIKKHFIIIFLFLTLCDAKEANSALKIERKRLQLIRYTDDKIKVRYNYIVPHIQLRDALNS